MNILVDISFSRIYLGVELLGHMISTCATLLGDTNLFSKVVTPTFGIDIIFKCKLIVSHLVLVCTSLNTNEIGHLFMFT